jgi:hypothetical protein
LKSWKNRGNRLHRHRAAVIILKSSPIHHGPDKNPGKHFKTGLAAQEFVKEICAKGQHAS